VKLEAGDQKKDGADTGIGALRVAIDAVDDQIVALLNRRAALAREVGEIKRASDAPVYRPEREAQIIDRLRAKNTGPLSLTALASIYLEVISACREIERRLRVAFLGPEGTFSELAMYRHFGHGIDPVPCQSIDEVFKVTESGAADFGVVPIENSTEGAVSRSLDLFLQTPLKISGEVLVPVRHNLLAQSNSLAGIRRICAHPQALAQCNVWLERHAHGIELVAVASNAEGAQLAAADPATAAIAGDAAALRYGLQVAAPGIQDDPANRTRFSIIGRHECEASGRDQTSLILAVQDRPGAMHSLIEPLARHKVSMKRLESRPARQGRWEYYFYIDIAGHWKDSDVAPALEELQRNAAFYKVIGSYPRLA
jgi:chorismate mutase/prephenate dehydratase